MLLVGIENGDETGKLIRNRCGIVKDIVFDDFNVIAKIKLFDFQSDKLRINFSDIKSIKYSLVGYGKVGDDNIVIDYRVSHVGAYPDLLGYEQ
jgi:hypothetical protein